MKLAPARRHCCSASWHCRALRHLRRRGATTRHCRRPYGGDWRTDEAKARDQYRHPVESLTFWGLKPGMTILEIQPGSQSWWTDILAPYAKTTGGAFYATGADLANPKLSEGARKARSSFEARYLAKPGAVR